MKLLFAALLALWLILNQSLAPAHLLLGAALALAGMVVLSRLEPRSGRARGRPLVVARLIALLIDDIVRSNFAVARIVLGFGRRGRTAGFLTLPLELRHPGGLAAIACIITATPGTSWVGYDRERNALTIHVLDLADEEAWVRFFKDRYERMLLEIFE
jgi:multicomponent K+:H+ antiporter subunit E